MQAIIFVLLIALIFILVHAGIIWAAAFVLLVIIADLIGGIFSSIFGFAKATKNVVYETALEEAAEVEAAKGKPPSGKKFFADVASKIGKGVGKGGKGKNTREKKTEEEKKRENTCSVQIFSK